MAGITTRRVGPGERIDDVVTTDWLGAVGQTVRQVSSLRGSTGGSANAGPGGYTNVLIRNDTEDNAPMFGILGIDDGFVIDPGDNLNEWKRTPILKGVAPNVDHSGKFVILTEPIASGKIGSCCVYGIIVKIDVVDESHGFADVTDGETGYLTSSTAGLCRIIQKEAGTGQKWALVAYGGGGGDCDCPNYWYQITYTGQASSSTFQLIITIPGASGSPWTLNVPYNQSPSGLKAQIDAIGPFASAPADYKVAVHSDDDGSLPGNTLNLTFSIPSSETLSARRGTNSSNAFVFVANMKKPEV